MGCPTNSLSLVQALVSLSIYVLCVCCHDTHSFLIYIVQLYLFLLMFGGFAGREMQVLDIALSVWCTQSLIPFIKTSQGQWSYGRVTEQLKVSPMLQAQQFLTKSQTLTHTYSLSQGWHFSVFSSFPLCDYSGIQQNFDIPMGLFRGPVSHKSLQNKPSPLGCCCCYSSLGQPCTSPHVVPGSLDCPRIWDQSGQPLALVSGQILGGFSLVSSKQRNNFVTFRHMVLSRRLWERGMGHLQSENSVFKKLLLKGDWVMRSPNTLD